MDRIKIELIITINQIAIRSILIDIITIFIDQSFIIIY